MRVEFAKLNGAGNDFVMIADFGNKLQLTPEQVAHICDRHFGVGADGVILVKPSARPECAAYMDYYNADGTKAQMCGNGVRCFAKFLVDTSHVSAASGSFVADTLSGPKPITFTLNADGTMKNARVNMGMPALDAKLIPTTLAASPLPAFSDNEADNKEDNAAFINALKSTFKEAVIEQTVLDEHPDYKFTCVSMGNPHAVCFLNSKEELNDEVVLQVGSAVESSVVFAEKTNVEFAYIEKDKDKSDVQDIFMRVYERGCGETLACGTGCCATAVAAYLSGKIQTRKVNLHVLGGIITIEWCDDLNVYMTGPAQTSFTGLLDLND